MLTIIMIMNMKFFTFILCNFIFIFRNFTFFFFILWSIVFNFLILVCLVFFFFSMNKIKTHRVGPNFRFGRVTPIQQLFMANVQHTCKTYLCVAKMERSGVFFCIKIMYQYTWHKIATHFQNCKAPWWNWVAKEPSVNHDSGAHLCLTDFN